MLLTLDEVRQMVEVLVVLTTIGVFLLGPLGWRLWRDRREARALRADIQHAVNRALKGESLVSVEVTPKTPWRAGRVLLSAPADWAWLLAPLLDTVLGQVPPGYEVVVRPGRRPALGSGPRAHEFSRAA